MDKPIEEISIERENVEKTLEALHEVLQLLKKTVVELAAIGSFLHHSYNGMENIIKRILKFNEVQIPTTSSSHKDLLNVAVAHSIISQDLSDKLDKYRGFRHFFVHGYGVLLDEEELRPLAKNLSEVWNQFNNEIENYTKKLYGKSDES